MTSKSIYNRVCYTYLIGWSKYNIWYYGSKTASDANPDTFWVEYFTSSKGEFKNGCHTVESFRKEYGEPDIIQIRKLFGENTFKCLAWEKKVLRRLKVKDNSKFLNQNDQAIYSAGMLLVQNLNGDRLWIKNTDIRIKSGEYFSINKNKCVAYDPNTSAPIGAFPSNDIRFKTGEFVYSGSNKSIAKCKITGISEGMIPLDDPRWKTGDIVGIMKGIDPGTSTWIKGTAVAVNSKTGESLGRISLDDPRWKSGDIISHRNGKSNSTVKKMKMGTSPAKSPITGLSLGNIKVDDPRWKTGEIVGIKRKLNA